MTADEPRPPSNGSARRWPEVPPIRAGLRCRCPRCGQGRLFEGLLAVRPRCEVCGLDLSPHDSGDGPAVFVILILGALVVPLAFAFETAFEPPIWAHLLLWPPVIMVLAIAMLRPMKATLVAYHFKNLRHQYDG
jgi:uncharacterized protein (DUF983 family)